MTRTRRISLVLVALAAMAFVAPSTTHADHCGYGWGRGYVGGGYRTYYRSYSYGYRPYSYRTYSYGYRPHAYGYYSVQPRYAYRGFSYATPYAYPYPYYSYRPIYGPTFPGYYAPTFRSYSIGPGFNPYYGGLYYGRSGYYRGPGIGFFIY